MCHACGKRVYAMEQRLVEGLVFHKDCFRCTTCSRKLENNYAKNELGFFCMTHFHQIAKVTCGYKTGTGPTRNAEAAGLVDAMVRRDSSISRLSVSPVASPSSAAASSPLAVGPAGSAEATASPVPSSQSQRRTAEELAAAEAAAAEATAAAEVAAALAAEAAAEAAIKAPAALEAMEMLRSREATIKAPSSVLEAMAMLPSQEVSALEAMEMLRSQWRGDQASIDVTCPPALPNFSTTVGSVDLQEHSTESVVAQEANAMVEN